MTYSFDGVPFESNTEAGQEILARAHRTGKRIDCQCRTPWPKMYVAAVNGRFIVKRMPETGAEHAPDCTSYMPPAELSGLAPLIGSAINEMPEENQTQLRVEFSLKKRRKPRAAPEPSDLAPAEAKETPRKLTLTALLHYLWQDAGLATWYPAMGGKRYWGVVYKALTRASAGKVMSGKDLSRTLFVPDHFRAENIEAETERRNTFLAQFRISGGSMMPLGLIIAEYKQHEKTQFGARVMFLHMPGCPFFMDEDLLKRFENVFAGKINMISCVEKAHPVMIATFGIARGGYPVLNEIGLMPVTKHWIPFANLREVELITALVDQKRAFQKSLRFNLKPDVPIATAVLCEKAPRTTALFMADAPDNADQVAALCEVAESGSFETWLWLDDGPMPPLPARWHSDGPGGEGDLFDSQIGPVPSDACPVEPESPEASDPGVTESEGVRPHV